MNESKHARVIESLKQMARMCRDSGDECSFTHVLHTHRPEMTKVTDVHLDDAIAALEADDFRTRAELTKVES